MNDERDNQRRPDDAPPAAPDSADERPPTPGDDEPSHYKLSPPPSLLDAAADTCPNCSAPMPGPDAVVCMRCGYDLAANTVRKTEVGVVEVEEDAGPPEGRAFVRAGKLGWRIPLGIGVAAVVAAAVISGIHAPARSFAHALATLLFAPVHAGIGVGAAALTARLMEDRFGRIEHAAARMVLAVGVFLLCFHIGQAMAIHQSLQFLLGAGLGAGLYFLIVWWFFSLTRTVATMLASIHLVLWAVFMGLLELRIWLATPVAPS